MPIYNRSKHLDASIPSVLGQEFSSFELICVDDGSSDDSVDKVKALQKKDDRVKLIVLEDNQGRCIARNKGIRAARGEWIAFLDSDDTYYANHLKTLYKLIQSEPGFRCYASGQKIGNEKKEKSPEQLRILKTSHFLKKNLLSLNQLCYDRKLDVLFPDRRIPISEDWLFIRLITLKTDILKSFRITVELGLHDQRSVYNTDWKVFAHWNRVTGELFADEHVLSKRIKKSILSYTYLLCANIILSKTREKKESIVYLKKALNYFESYHHPLFYKALIKLALPSKH